MSNGKMNENFNDHNHNLMITIIWSNSKMLEFLVLHTFRLLPLMADP